MAVIPSGGTPKQSIAEMAQKQAASSQINSIPASERNKGPEADDRDIVHGTTPMNTGAGVALDGLIQEADRDLVMNPASMDYERFMNQILTIHVHDAGGPEDSDFCEVTVNGEYKLIVRGETADIKRCHAEVLARAKHMRVVQKKVTQNDGSIGYEERAVLKHTYPFSVIHDPAGRRGADWLKQLFKNPN